LLFEFGEFGNPSAETATRPDLFQPIRRLYFRHFKFKNFHKKFIENFTVKGVALMLEEQAVSGIPPGRHSSCCQAAIFHPRLLVFSALFVFTPSMTQSQTAIAPPPAPAPVAINRLKALLAQANSGVARTADAVAHFLQPSAATNRAKLKQKRRSKDSGKSIDSAIKSSSSVATQVILASAPLSLGSLETVGVTESSPVDSMQSLATLASGATISEEKLSAWRLSTDKVQRLLVAALSDASVPDG
jgi:hypothetical protein